YGTMADAEELIHEVHRRGMHIVFDMIFGHTSIEHPWFRESRRSRDNPRADWYIWREGRRARGATRNKGGRPPTNWKSITGVNGWQYEPLRDQWFYTNFLHFQPDLNFRNPQVKEAMFGAVRFWLDKGVDGFRLDIFHAIYKDDRFRDNPFSFRVGQPVDSNDGANQIKKYTMNLPENVELARELRELTDRWSPERVLIGEVFGEHQVIRRYLGSEEGPGEGPRAAPTPGLHAIFLFEMLRFSFRASFFRRILTKFEALYPAPLVPTLVLGNHDRPRWISRIGGDREAARRKARCIALLQLTARGIPVVYYGEEIGMEDGDFPFAGALDPVARQFAWLPRWVARAFGLYLNRDGCRTPMQWEDGPGAGFSGGGAEVTPASPWLPVHPDYRVVNVATQRQDPESLLNLYRDLLGLRARSAALREGDFTLLEGDGVPRSVLCYRREAPSDGAPSDEALLVAINFGRRTATFAPPALAPPALAPDARVLARTSPEARMEGDKLVLPPASGLILGRGIAS
ncbi:MAG: DUF3459 domain-containing protein, partial [Spirochaetaceae bacterium]